MNVFNKRMGGGSGSASIQEAKRALGKTETGLCLIGLLLCGTTWDGVIYQHGSVFGYFIKILYLLGFHPVISIIWECI